MPATNALKYADATVSDESRALFLPRDTPAASEDN